MLEEVEIYDVDQELPVSRQKCFTYLFFFLNHFIYPEQTLAHASFHCLSSMKLYIEIAGSEYS